MFEFQDFFLVLPGLSYQCEKKFRKMSLETDKNHMLKCKKNLQGLLLNFLIFKDAFPGLKPNQGLSRIFIKKKKSIRCRPH